MEEGQRSLYVKQDDHYVLNAEGLPVAEDIQGLKVKHTELVEKENALKDQLQRYSGIDLQYYAAVMRQFDNEVESALIDLAGRQED